MASRYLVGLGAGAKTWNSSNTNLWASTSGGASGASVPTSVDDVFFDANSGSANNLTISGNALACKTLTCTGFTGTVVATSVDVLSVFGNVNLGTTGHFTGLGGMLLAINSTCSFTSGGRNPNAVLYIPTGLSPTATLQDDIDTTGASVQNGLYIVGTGGTINTNGKTVRCGLLTDAGAGGTFTFGASQITIIDQFVMASGTTINANTSTLILDANGGVSNSNAFRPLGKTLNNVRFTNGTFHLLSDNATINVLTVDANAVVADGNGSTWTITDMVTYSGSQWGDFTGGDQPPTLSKASGTISVNKAKITNSIATGGATWKCIDGVDGGGNSGWIFSQSYTGFNRIPHLTYLRR